MTEHMTMPGDELAASEEYMPGPGTHERGGIIYASVMGRAVFNRAEKTVSVNEVKPVRALRPGDAVLGEVTMVTANLVTVHVTGPEEGGEIVGRGGTGVIHISKVTVAFIDDARKEFHAGDMVRARVIQAEPSLQLSTREPDLGVLKGLCTRCRGTMSNRRGALFCPDCDRSEHRKLAGDFSRFTPEHVEPRD